MQFEDDEQVEAVHGSYYEGLLDEPEQREMLEVSL